MAITFCFILILKYHPALYSQQILYGVVCPSIHSHHSLVNSSQILLFKYLTKWTRQERRCGASSATQIISILSATPIISFFKFPSCHVNVYPLTENKIHVGNIGPTGAVLIAYSCIMDTEKLLCGNNKFDYMEQYNHTEMSYSHVQGRVLRWSSKCCIGFHSPRLTHWPLGDFNLHSGETDEANCSWLHPVWPPPKQPDQDNTFCVVSRASTELIFCIHRDFDVRNKVCKPRRLVCQCCRDISAWKSRVMKPTVLGDEANFWGAFAWDEANWVWIKPTPHLRRA